MEVLKLLQSPGKCIECDRPAYWAFMGNHCYEHLCEKAQNPRLRDMLHIPMSTPEVSSVSHSAILISIYPTTMIHAICYLLNRLWTIYPSMDAEPLVTIERYEYRPISLEDRTPILISTGVGSYYISTITLLCNAPTITSIDAVSGSMVDFAGEINVFSSKMCKCIDIEQKY